MSEQSIFARLLFALAGHSRTGLRLKPIADGIGESPSTTLRNLQRLAEDGLVERSPFDQDNWRLSPELSRSPWPIRPRWPVKNGSWTTSRTATAVAPTDDEDRNGREAIHQARR